VLNTSLAFACKKEETKINKQHLFGRILIQIIGGIH